MTVGFELDDGTTIIVDQITRFADTAQRAWGPLIYGHTNLATDVKVVCVQCGATTLIPATKWLDDEYVLDALYEHDAEHEYDVDYTNDDGSEGHSRWIPHTT